jgi:hypothetical protein
MSGYDLAVEPRSRAELEQLAVAWRDYFGMRDAWAPGLPRLLEIELPKLLPRFALRVLARGEMPDAEARTWHDVPAIDMREDVYDALCNGVPRARFTAAHELGHLFLHSGESRPRAVNAIRNTMPRDRSSEKQANEFAASFLMPSHVLHGQFDAPAELRMTELLLWPKRRKPIPEVMEFLRQMRAKSKREE